MAGLANGNWKNWLLGVLATVMGSLVVNGIAFQRDTREQLKENQVKIEQLRVRDENIIKYLQQLSNERINSVDAAMLRLEKRIETLERR